MISDFSSTHLTQLWGVQDLVFVSSLMIFICRFVRKYALGPEPWSVTTAQYVTTPTPTWLFEFHRTWDMTAFVSA